MQDNDEVPLEEMIAIEQVAEELWRKATKGSDMEWQALSVLAKQAWRNCARMEVTIWRRRVGQPQAESPPTDEPEIKRRRLRGPGRNFPPN